MVKFFLRIFFIYIFYFDVEAKGVVNVYDKTLYGEQKIGKKYKIAGKIYRPQNYKFLAEEGYISWYGPGFNNKKTANGAIFNEKNYTVAHKTLQLPSVIEITNLENGKKVIAIVNDRGPFSGVQNRILDVSVRIAQELDFLNEGVVRGKIKLLPQETKAFLAGKRVKLGLLSLAPHDRAVCSKKNCRNRHINFSKTLKKHDLPKSEYNLYLLKGSYIQVGAFRNYENALQMVEKLKKDQFTNIHVGVEKKENNLRMQVVKVGPIENLSEEKLLTKLKALGYDNARIIKVR